ncbi:MAG: hypothetical protein ACTSO3_01030 [Candidatus Heimdallarchaeaceae archaeon]
MSEYNKYNECDECPIIEDKLKLLGQKRELKKVLNKIKKLVNSKDCNCNKILEVINDIKNKREE